jgi:hypothetical protein
MIAHLIAANRSDLEVGLGFLRISKQIKDMGEIRRARGVYVSTIRLSKPFKEVADTISARFGRFVQLRKP